MIARIAAAPLARFMVLGALLLCARWATDDGRALGLGRDTIHIPTGEVERLRREWTAETGREPAAEELRAAVQREADEEMLVREALRLGLDRSDPVARSRLVQNLRFVGAARGRDDDAALLAEASALGMAAHDLVVRRRLVQAMEQRLATRVSIDEGELRDYIARHASRYDAPARIAFRQVLAGGEPFLLGDTFPLWSQAQIGRAFGESFAREAMQLPLHTWSGPLRSTYGLHFVYVTQRREAAPAELASVRRQARYALLEEREQQAARDGLVALRRHYPLDVEWPAMTLAVAP